MEPLYILTRTSGRRKFYERCRDSVRALSWPGGVTWIVHTDDPRDTYVDADIIVQGEAHGPYMGSGSYNLYNNRLLSAIPGDGWVHFIDDDDEYASADVFENLLEGASKKKLQIGKVCRGGSVVWPKTWGTQRSFQTECFCVWSELAKKGKWWADKGGDHYYTRQLVRQSGTQWHDVMIAVAQEGKSHGKRVDIGGEQPDYTASIKPSEKVWFKMFIDKNGRRGGKLYDIPYSEALTLEKYDFGRVTFKGVTVG